MLLGMKSWFASLLFHPWGLGATGIGVRISFPRRLRGKKNIYLGRGVRIGSNVWLEAIKGYKSQEFDSLIEIGDNVIIGRNAIITAISKISIGQGSLLSEGVYISDHSHDVMGEGDIPLAERPLIIKGNVDIGACCFIGFRACILPGVSLGEKCVVGANSVVTHSFPVGSVLAGVPAKIIRKKLIYDK